MRTILAALFVTLATQAWSDNGAQITSYDFGDAMGHATDSPLAQLQLAPANYNCWGTQFLTGCRQRRF